ncbi:hypothetical protein [Actinomadura hibisca]|uniref:hypothetical protein n=1 Tax=Actinomadura hibisca TaxID=68565 RepID=UPI0012F8784F|nr:hypothetical protein [Actinomadura hibisca]
MLERPSDEQISALRTVDVTGVCQQQAAAWAEVSLPGMKIEGPAEPSRSGRRDRRLLPNPE